MEEQDDIFMEAEDLQPEAETPEEPPQPADTEREAEFEEFVRQYPHVDAANIPPEVWQDMKQGTSLLQAYRGHEVRQLRGENENLRQQLETMQQQADARSRSLGSVRSTGKTGQSDGFLMGFEDA